MKIGFIGLGNVGAKLAGSLLRNGFELCVRDLDPELVQPFLDKGATTASSSAAVAAAVDVIITCLPSPVICAEVMEAGDGILAGLTPGKIWLEMSTTDEAEVRRLGEKVILAGAIPMEAPVSGGCHRAASGHISIFAGGDRRAFEQVLPILGAMGHKILHTGGLGSASVLKVITNYLAFVNLVSVGEALMVAKQAGLDLNMVYEGIAMSSGNSFVHETESQVILNGSYNINFTMDLVLKDLSLFEDVALQHDVPLEISPQITRIFKDGQEKFGARAWSSMIVKRLEDACQSELRATGFPAELTDDTPEVPGFEVTIPTATG